MRLLDNIKSQSGWQDKLEGYGGFFQWWADLFMGTDSQRRKDDFLLRTALASDARMTQAFHRSLSDDGIITAASNIGVFIGSLFDRAEANTYKTAAPIVQAVVMMIFVMFLPLLMALSLFDIGRLMTLTVLMFTFIFWGYLFALAHYFENFMLESLLTSYNDASLNEHSLFFIATMGTIAENNDLSLQVIQWISRGAYVLLPMLFTVFLGLAGHHLGGAVGSLMGTVAGPAARKGGEGVGQTVSTSSKVISKLRSVGRK